ncbi:protein IQ-DOMAIN 13-like [Bidens hawaiensis]|uniref:protein IQ-DOMAIN 13-like n=1 Tax=Bidens hawaiensis TaxID=980011 RepID=UPI004049738E
MGKKATWILAIKRLVACNSNEGHKKSRKGRGRLKRGSFFPFFREPSSIEQILEETDQHNVYAPTTQSQSQPESQPQAPPPPPPPQPPPSPPPPQTQSQPQSQSPPQPQSQPQPPKPQAQAQPSSSSSRRHVSPPPKRLTSPPRITSPPKVSHTPEPTLQQRHLSATRIQAVYRGYTARKNTRNLTGLGRFQKVVTSISVKRQTVNAMKQMQLLIRVQTQIQSRRVQMLENQALKPQPDSSNSQNQSEEHWDGSLVTKEEREARLQRKADALIKRERAMAYAYSHQLSKGTPTATHNLPWWWKWLQHQLPYHTTATLKNHQFATTPSRSTHKQLDRPTTPMSSSSTNRFMKARKAASLYSMKDDDSLRSCPPFSVPHYMSPTASTRAKARPTSNPKERCGTPTTPGSCSDTSKRRLSFPFTPNSARSVGDFSMDSSLGRKPFNRFV